MELILDSANIKQIRELNDLLTVTGVTTNPSIITKSGKEPRVVIDELISVLSEDQLLFIQVVKTDFEGMMKHQCFLMLQDELWKAIFAIIN